MSPYDTSSLMFKIYSRMSEYFLSKNSLTFFMGGDNFMVVTNSEFKTFAKDFIQICKIIDAIVYSNRQLAGNQ